MKRGRERPPNSPGTRRRLTGDKEFQTATCDMLNNQRNNLTTPQQWDDWKELYNWKLSLQDIKGKSPHCETLYENAGGEAGDPEVNKEQYFHAFEQCCGPDQENRSTPDKQKIKARGPPCPFRQHSHASPSSNTPVSQARNFPWTTL